MIIVLKMKHGDYPVYARDDAERDRAYLHLFNLLDEYGYYAEVDGDKLDWLERARKGNARAARWLLDCRSDCGARYQTIETVYPLEP